MRFRHADIQTELPITFKCYAKDNDVCHDNPHKISWHFGICTIAGLNFASFFSFVEAKPTQNPTGSVESLLTAVFSSSSKSHSAPTSTPATSLECQDGQAGVSFSSVLPTACSSPGVPVGGWFRNQIGSSSSMHAQLCAL